MIAYEFLGIFMNLPHRDSSETPFTVNSFFFLTVNDGWNLTSRGLTERCSRTAEHWPWPQVFRDDSEEVLWFSEKKFINFITFSAMEKTAVVQKGLFLPELLVNQWGLNGPKLHHDFNHDFSSISMFQLPTSQKIWWPRNETLLRPLCSWILLWI